MVLALVGLGFGHQKIAPDPVDLTAYAMPDGTLPQLCLDATGDDRAAHNTAGHDAQTKGPCPVCTLATGFVLAVQPEPAALILAAQMADWPAPQRVEWLSAASRAPPARGPPISFLI
jgi:hypothetical protein